MRPCAGDTRTSRLVALVAVLALIGPAALPGVAADHEDDVEVPCDAEHTMDPAGQVAYVGPDDVDVWRHETSVGETTFTVTPDAPVAVLEVTLWHDHRPSPSGCETHAGECLAVGVIPSPAHIAEPCGMTGSPAEETPESLWIRIECVLCPLDAFYEVTPTDSEGA